MTKIFKKLEKTVNICKICVFLASACSSVASHAGGGGVLMGVATVGWGLTAGWGWEGNRGGSSGGGGVFNL